MAAVAVENKNRKIGVSISDDLSNVEFQHIQTALQTVENIDFVIRTKYGGTTEVKGKKTK